MSTGSIWFELINITERKKKKFFRPLNGCRMGILQILKRKYFWEFLSKAIRSYGEVSEPKKKTGQLARMLVFLKYNLILKFFVAFVPGPFFSADSPLVLNILTLWV